MIITRTSVALLVSLALAGSSVAQNNIWFAASGTADWNVANSWLAASSGGGEVSGVPNVSFDEIALVGNNATAFIAGAAPNVGGVVIGHNTAGPNALSFVGPGAVEIRNGGSLAVVRDGTTPNLLPGSVIVGSGGNAGSLSVLRGGTLNASLLSTNAIGEGTTTFGGGTSGTAIIEVDAATLGHNTRIIGPNVQFTANQLQLTGSSNLTAEITGPTHSAINVSGLAILDGALTVDFNGVSPAIGQSWTVATAGAVLGQFDSVSTPDALPVGTGLDVEQVASGANTSVNVSLERILSLQVNRQSGAVTIVNQGSSTLSFDGYSIASADGVFDSSDGVWNSLSDDGIAGWVEANTSANLLAELQSVVPSNPFSLPAAGTRGLGTPYRPAFGTLGAEELSFSFVNADGREITGDVEFVGTPTVNNLKLTVDPATGNARLTNDSTTPVDVDIYTITSQSGVLLPAFDGLSGADGWLASPGSVNGVSESNALGSKPLSPGESFAIDGLMALGTTEATRDLVLQFNDVNMGLFTGVVVYDTLAAGLPGDYNNDGNVNLADYTVWRDNLGSTTFAFPEGSRNPSLTGPPVSDDYVFWKQNFGTPAASQSLSASVVPEPSGTALLAGLLSIAHVLATGLRSRTAARSAWVC